MLNFTDIVTEAMSPEDRKLYDKLYHKRRQMAAKGKDTTEIDAQMAQLKSGAGIGKAGAPTSQPVKHSKDWDEGYQAAIEAMKQAKAGEIQPGSQSSAGGQSDGLSLPAELFGGQNDQEGSSSQSSGDGKNSRDAAGSNGKSVGRVRPEDCTPIGSVDSVPGTAGAFVDGQTGNDITTAEGHEADTASDAAVENEWKNAALQAASKMKGAGAGDLKSKIEGLYKTTQDWKKALRTIVGHSLNPEDKRSAYANKNVLISQDRIARTEKDKYDNMDYMMVFIDSSGSMSDKQLKVCLSEVYALALAKKPIKLVVVQCDTRIQDIKEYRTLVELKRDMIHATVKGRGGTDLKPCWDMLKTNPRFNKRPAELVMVFTDGYLDQYARNPRTMQNLCWVILNNPSFQIKYKDVKTKLVCIDTEQIKA